MERPTEPARGDSAAGPSDGDRTPIEAPVSEPRQRWRIVFARPSPSDRSHRELVEAWIADLAAGSLPLPRSAGRPRPPLAFAAPLPHGVVARRELADLWLAERLPIASVRSAVLETIPAELELRDLHDVWLGAPALAASLIAAEYRVDLSGIPEDGMERLRAAAERLLAAPALERERARGSGTVRYDLRPLVDDVSVDRGSRSLLIRTAFHPERGAGRPEEVLAALTDLDPDGPLPPARAITRERLILAGESIHARGPGV